MHLKKLFSIIQEKLLLLNDSMACCKMVQRNKFEMMWHHIVTSYVLLSKISGVTKQDLLASARLSAEGFFRADPGRHWACWTRIKAEQAARSSLRRSVPRRAKLQMLWSLRLPWPAEIMDSKFCPPPPCSSSAMLPGRQATSLPTSWSPSRRHRRTPGSARAGTACEPRGAPRGEGHGAAPGLVTCVALRDETLATWPGATLRIEPATHSDLGDARPASPWLAAQVADGARGSYTSHGPSDTWPIPQLVRGGGALCLGSRAISWWAFSVVHTWLLLAFGAQESQRQLVRSSWLIRQQQTHGWSCARRGTERRSDDLAACSALVRVQRARCLPGSVRRKRADSFTEARRASWHVKSWTVICNVTLFVVWRHFNSYTILPW